MAADPHDLHCRAASRLLSDACDRPLSASEVAALRYHLDECFMCRNFRSHLEFLHEAAERLRSGK
jgi:hypothetical protein